MHTIQPTVYDRVRLQKSNSTVPYYLLVNNNNFLSIIAQESKKSAFWLSSEQLTKVKRNCYKFCLQSYLDKRYTHKTSPWEVLLTSGCSVENIQNSYIEHGNYVHWYQDFQVKSETGAFEKNVQLICKRFNVKTYSYKYTADDIISFHFGTCPPTWPSIQVIHPNHDRIFAQNRKNSLLYLISDSAKNNILASKLEGISKLWEVPIEYNSMGNLLTVYRMEDDFVFGNFIKIEKETFSYFEKDKECLIIFSQIFESSKGDTMSVVNPSTEGKSLICCEGLQHINIFTKFDIPMEIDDKVPAEISKKTVYKKHTQYSINLLLPVSQLVISKHHNFWKLTSL